MKVLPFRDRHCINNECTIEEFNKAVSPVEFDFSKRDGKCTTESTIDKSNWLPKDSPPFRTYAVACGITFTHGGLKIDPRCVALNADDTVPKLLSFESLRQIESERFSPRRN